MPQVIALVDATAAQQCADALDSEIRRLTRAAFDLAATRYDHGVHGAAFRRSLPVMLEDLATYQSRDPATRQRPIECLMSVHATFFAVLTYRLARALLDDRPEDEESFLDAMRLSWSARAHTGVEIHPEARIGRRLVIDHGWGTVIGQTTEIGDDAYILHNVMLGARAVSDAACGKRHPTIGHRVQIAGGARIFGAITVGDDCFIGPDVTLTSDLGPRRRVLASRRRHVVSMREAPSMQDDRP
jgi:serine O-acetyltransferase